MEVSLLGLMPEGSTPGIPKGVSLNEGPGLAPKHSTAQDPSYSSLRGAFIREPPKYLETGFGALEQAKLSMNKACQSPETKIGCLSWAFQSSKGNKLHACMEVFSSAELRFPGAPV